jgi:enoyl-CoA hydratase/carnithine racemase
MNDATPTFASDLCLVALDRPIATVTLNRPQAKNALNIDLLSALVARLEECAAAGVSVLVLRAEGTAFCAGADIRSDDGTSIGRPGLRRDLIEQAIALVQAFPIAISVVDGPAVGGGWGIAFAADVVLATENARFKFPELSLGFLPPKSIVQRFHRVAGPAKAVRLLGSGEWFGSHSPALVGLVEVVTSSAMDDRVAELTDQFSSSAPGLLRVLKQSINSVTTQERSLS